MIIYVMLMFVVNVFHTYLVHNPCFQFPFYVNGKEYNTCTMDYTAPGETPWCATKVTSNYLSVVLVG